MLQRSDCLYFLGAKEPLSKSTTKGIWMTGAELIEQVRKAITERGEKPATDRAVAKRLGISVPTLTQWKKRPDVTPQQVAKLLLSVDEAAEYRTQAGAIRPIVEFFQVQKGPYGSGGKFRIFSGKDENGADLPYLTGLRAELRENYGVYIFYDSRGRALYAGKARYQTLWDELHNAFNRSRSVQNILRVKHLQSRKDFRTSDEVSRQIRPVNVPLHELAEYVSAYRVADGMVDNVESLLIRAFPNDLLNKRIENLVWE